MWKYTKEVYPSEFDMGHDQRKLWEKALRKDDPVYLNCEDGFIYYRGRKVKQYLRLKKLKIHHDRFMETTSITMTDPSGFANHFFASMMPIDYLGKNMYRARARLMKVLIEMNANGGVPTDVRKYLSERIEDVREGDITKRDVMQLLSVCDASDSKP